MVISIEPGVYVPGLGGCRHSDTVLVTKTGYELLTRLPTDLASLTLRGWRPMARLRGRFIRRALRVAHKERVYARCPVRGGCGEARGPMVPATGFA